MKSLRYLFVLFVLCVFACGGTGGSSVPDSNDGGSVQTGTGDTTTSEPAAVTVTASPTGITVGGATSSVTATVTDSEGDNVDDGTTVTFSINSSTLGTITATATTYNGSATSSFTSSSTPGTAVITATAGSVSNTVSITVSAADTGSIVFSSATPQVVGIKGGGQIETSLVTFAVKDVNGNAVVDGISVDFVMSGPSGGRLPAAGGEYIGELDSSPTTASASTVNGNASVYLNSGTVAGPVTIIASVDVDGETLSASSAVISIGGGKPSATHINLAASVLNLYGLRESGLTSTITMYIGDRFGNFNVLEGTSVSFYTEAGAIDRSDKTDAEGKTSVTLRTQAPDPEDVAITSDEADDIDDINTLFSSSYPSDGSGPHPRDGRVTVLATVQGEEAFEDANGNGLYDGDDDGTYETGTDEFFDDLGEPFIDKNDDGCRNSGTTKTCYSSSTRTTTVSASTDPFEEYIDADGDGSYDPPNGVWDGPACTDTGCQTSKMIWTDMKLVFTGNASECSLVASGGNDIATATGSKALIYMIADSNLNSPVKDTELTVSVSGAVTLVSGSSIKIPDGVSGAPYFVNITVQGNNGEGTGIEPYSVKVSVSSSDIVVCGTVSITGQVAAP